MSTGKKNNSEKDPGKAEEPKTAFKNVHFFNSFEEENEFTAKQRASLSHDECLKQVEELRKRVFHKYLLPDGQWPSISEKFEIVEPYTNEAGK